jgi:AraC-like DNA-binding protein
MASGWTSSGAAQSISHMPARNILTMLAGAFLHHTRPFRQFGPCGLSNRDVTVGSAAVKTLVAHPEDLAGHPVRPGPPLGLVDGYLQLLTSLDEPPSPELEPIISGHPLDLVAAALGPTAEAAEIIAKRGVKAARLRAAPAEIARRFSDPDFDLDHIVGTPGLSRRYIQQLLEETGRSFTERVVERRLERALAMLTDPRRLHLAILDIALAACFGDVSHFNRVFHRRFGDTPSGVRAQRPSRSRNDPAIPQRTAVVPTPISASHFLTTYCGLLRGQSRPFARVGPHASFTLTADIRHDKQVVGFGPLAWRL